jgi:hypothetical protein
LDILNDNFILESSLKEQISSTRNGPDWSNPNSSHDIHKITVQSYVVYKYSFYKQTAMVDLEKGSNHQKGRSLNKLCLWAELTRREMAKGKRTEA